MTDDVPHRKVIKESIALRAKYKTKRQAPRQNLMCSQIVPHPKNRGGEPIRTSRTKTLAADILAAGYDPTEAIVDSVVVEVGVDVYGDPEMTFSDHFKANAGLDPDHYVNHASNIVLFAGPSHNSKHLTQRNIFNGRPGSACDPPATCLDNCFYKAKPILSDQGQTHLVGRGGSPR